MDLSGFLVVLPVASAGRRLEEILVQRAVDRALPLVPPDIVTVGHLPERLYHPAKPIADDGTLKLAWTEAIRRTDRAKLAPFFPVLPAEDEIVGWMAAAEVIDRLHVELAAERLDFAQVSQRGAKLAAFNEANRWKLLSQIQERWLHRIEELGFNDKHAARRSAIDERRCTTERQLVLVATVDLNEVQRAMIDQVAAQTTALVFAPQAWADRFDPLGCVICKPWCSASMELSDDQIEQADDPAAQADAAVRAIAAYDGRFAADEITVGVVDERLTSSLEQRLNECGLHTRYGGGTPLSRTPPLRLLNAVVEFLEERRYTGLAALVRHPEVAAWLDREIKADWLTPLDEYYTRHLPRDFQGSWFANDKRSAAW